MQNIFYIIYKITKPHKKKAQLIYRWDEFLSYSCCISF